MLSIFRGLLGLIFILAIAFFFSEQRKKIQWKIVVIGLGFQILLAFLILNPFKFLSLNILEPGFELLGKVFVYILDFSKMEQIFYLAHF